MIMNISEEILPLNISSGLNTDIEKTEILYDVE